MSMIKIAVLAATALAVPGAALAHVTLQVGEAPADSYYRAVLQVGHGCEGAPTNEIRVKVPDGMQSAKPMPKAGWQVEAIKGKLAEPYESHARTITEDVTEIRWTGGNLPDTHYDEFVFRGKLPDRPAGTVLYVPVVQICEQGEHRWIEIPAEGQNPGDLDEPAPGVRLTGKAR
ncbi:MAG TPA: DUF1775 domain-containing protein [Arenibaculum sp.]|nr:DUF1775 domain-containing protein [Arenibaculum sp.]